MGYTRRVRPILVLLFAIIAYTLFHVIRMALLMRIGKRIVESSKTYERRIAGGTPRILVIGDSTGVGTGVSDPRLSIAGRLGTNFPQAYVRNESINGWKVADVLRHFPNVPEKSFDIILLQIGANDIMRGTPLPEFCVSLEAVFKKSVAAGGRVFALHSGNIGLAPIFAWPLSRIMRARTLRYREAYRRIAATNDITYVDLFHETADDPFQRKPEFYAPDLLHLTGKGYDDWYRALRRMMG